MKKLIVIILCLTCFSCTTKHASLKSPGYTAIKRFHGDTVAYITKNFIERKSSYVGKPFNVFLQDFEIPIKAYTLDFADDAIRYIYISENNHNMLDYKIQNDKNALQIIVYWAIPVSENDALTLVAKHHGVWTQDEINLFKNSIVKDLDMRDYLKKR